MIRRFLDLGVSGGYVWAQYRGLPGVKIGVIEPGSKPELLRRRWTNPRYVSRLGDVAILKTLRLTRVREVGPGKLMSLRAARPRQGTVCQWPRIGRRLENILEDRQQALRWESLSPDQLEVACSEFLREQTQAGLPRLSMLLMPPGRTMKDVDLYGVTPDDQEVFAQVTQRTATASNSKLRHLRDYAGDRVHLLFFCDVRTVEQQDGVTLVPNALVDDWLQARVPQSRRLLDCLD